MIRVRKNTVFMSVLIGELIFFLVIYCVSAHGIFALRALSYENRLREERLDQLKNEVLAVQQQLAIIEKEDFFKERIAREQLQMARAGDMIYYLT